MSTNLSPITLEDLLGIPPPRLAPRPGRRGLEHEAPLTDHEVWLRTESQAARIIAKCGGPAAVARLIGYDASQVFRWRYPEAPHPKRGTGGVIPRKALRKLIPEARKHGVLLTEDDLKPLQYKEPK